MYSRAPMLSPGLERRSFRSSSSAASVRPDVQSSSALLSSVRMMCRFSSHPHSSAGGQLPFLSVMRASAR
jgi:hypothetical protein